MLKSTLIPFFSIFIVPRFSFLFFISIFQFLSANAQSWSKPVIIFNEGYNEHPDFTVDKSGTIHCVWSHSVAIDFRKIYYSQSADNGITWTYPVDLSKNTNLEMTEPHIIADSINNLHVVYDYNAYNYSKTKICYIGFDGQKWSQPVYLADDMPGASHNRLAVDHDNRVYCFWFYGRIYYRTLVNGIWSKTDQPFEGNFDKFFINNVVVDQENNLHCIGIHHYEGQTSYDDRVIYFSMISNIWSSFIEMSDTLSWESCDIGLKKSGLPSFVWGQLMKDTSVSLTGTYFSEFLNSGMTNPVLLAINSNEQAMSIDANDQVHIVDNISISNDSFQLIHHYIEKGKWEQQVLQNNRMEFYHIRLKSYNSWIYMTTTRLDNDSPYNSSILFANYIVKTGLSEEHYKSMVEIFPNPVTEKLTIQLTSLKEEDVEILIKDYFGRTLHSIFKGHTTPGFMSFSTNSIEMIRFKVPRQLYFIYIQLGEKRFCKKVLYL